MGEGGVEVLGRERYEVLGELGRGGVGVVYRARDRVLGTDVALKKLHRPDRDSVERLKAEFRARANVHHEHLLQLFDLEVTSDHAFFTMELIEADDFLQWAIRGAGVAPRLARGVCKLVAALHALHEAGLLHRDVKPANVLVGADERVLLGDFGLAVGFLPEVGAPPRRREFAGTPAYMSPEQQRGDLLGPASDFYSVGVMIGEALSGSRPSGIGRRRRESAASGLPQPFGPLVFDLLDPDPRRRPGATRIVEDLAALAGRGAVEIGAAMGLRVRSRHDPFVGREETLAVLRDSLHPWPTDSVVAHLKGPSGIGKTTLATHALAQLDGEHSLLVLRGRCHIHERLDFRGVDGVVDDLQRHLQSVKSAVTDEPPEALRALARLFPSLRGLSAAEERSALSEHVVDRDPREVRRLGYIALRRLLARVAEGRRLVIWIDDLQWIGADGIDLLASLLQGAGIPGAVFLLSYRPEEEEGGKGVRERLAAGLDAGSTSVRQIELPLGPLATAEVESLFRALLPPGRVPGPERLAELARGTEGFPIFARELARHLNSEETEVAAPAPDGSERLAELLHRRIERIPAVQRTLVDALVVAAGPVSEAVVAIAAGVGEAAQPGLRALEQMGLLRRTTGETEVRVAPFHDRIRMARVERIAPAERLRLHRALAVAHEQLDTGEAQVLAHHWEAAGERARAGFWAVAAADHSAGNLAFAAAADYYQKAIDWLPEGPDSWQLRRKLGEARRNQGLVGEAALEFERAGTLLERAPDATPETRLERVRLLVRSSEQHFHCGQTLDGYRLMRAALAQLGVRLPRSWLTCLTTSIWLRLKVWLRGLAFRPRRESEVEAIELLRLDALWSACSSLLHINHALADVFLLQHLLGALRIGEPGRLLRSLVLEAATEATFGGRFFDRLADERLTAAEALVEHADGDFNRGWVAAARAAVAAFRSQWSEVARWAAQAEQHFANYRGGYHWERTVNDLYWLTALAKIGDAKALEARHRTAFDDARARRDRLAENHFRSGNPAALWLFRDDLETARREAGLQLDAGRWVSEDDRAAAQRFPEDSFRTPDFHNLVAYVERCLYEGDAFAAYARMERLWPPLERALLLRVQYVGIDLRFLLAKSALAVVVRLSRSETPPRDWPARNTIARLDRVAVRQRNAIRRDPNRCAAPYAALVDAALLGGRGATDTARARLAEAASGFDQLTMRAHAAAARFRLSELSPDPEKQPLQTAALAALDDLGIANPERLAGMLVPSVLPLATSPSAALRAR